MYCISIGVIVRVFICMGRYCPGLSSGGLLSYNHICGKQYQLTNDLSDSNKDSGQTSQLLGYVAKTTSMTNRCCVYARPVRLLQTWIRKHPTFNSTGSLLIDHYLCDWLILLTDHSADPDIHKKLLNKVIIIYKFLQCDYKSRHKAPCRTS